MSRQPLNISLIQPDIIWEDKAANLKHYESCIAGIREQREVVVLPEMFSTGFSMAPERLAEEMDGATVQWMKDMARRYRCILVGSLMITEGNHYFNRLIWMQPDGRFGYYDKRHLFAYAGEHQHYTAGSKRLIAQVKGWKICLQVCYDLRFPVWARQGSGLSQERDQRQSTGSEAEQVDSLMTDSGKTGFGQIDPEPEYDILLYVANWPERRNLAWKTLLQARAIENMSYVVGVNRVGNDGNGIYHSGDSSVFGPLGTILWQQAHEPVCHTLTLDKNALLKARQDFPFLQDADRFMIL